MLGFSVLRNMLHVHKNTEGISDLWSHMTKGRNWKLICVFIIVISINTVKVCNKQHLIRERKSEYAMREKAVLTMVNHPFIIKLFYTFQDVERLCILLPIQNFFNEFLFLFLAVFFYVCTFSSICINSTLTSNNRFCFRVYQQKRLVSLFKETVILWSSLFPFLRSRNSRGIGLLTKCWHYPQVCI